VKHSRLRVGLAAVLCAPLIKGLDPPALAQAKPEGEMRWALYVTLSPAWFDPGEVVGVLTPFWVLYALHDASSNRCQETAWLRAWLNPGR